MTRVAIVVVAYEGGATLLACLDRLIATRYPDFSIVVVDNGGGDDALASLHYPGVTALALPSNRGFAGGANAGARLARSRFSPDVLAFVNQDCLVDPQWLSPLVAELTTRDDVGIVGARLLEIDGVTIQHAGGRLLGNALTEHEGRGQRASDADSQAREADYVCGALVAIRAETWTEFGPFPESYFPAYFEEVELCVRLRRGGLKALYVPKSVATHLEAGVLGRDSNAFLRVYHESRLRFVVRNIREPKAWVRWLLFETSWLAHLKSWRELAPALRAYARVPLMVWTERSAGVGR